MRSSPASPDRAEAEPGAAWPAGQRPNDLRTLNESCRERLVLISSRERERESFTSSRWTCGIMAQRKKSKSLTTTTGYGGLLSGISELLDAARHTAARRVNSILTTTYWEIGRRIVEHELSGQHRADYGEQIIDLLAADLTRKHGRGFSRSNVFQMRGFFLAWEIVQTPCGKLESRAKFGGNSIVQTLSGQSVALIGTSNWRSQCR